MRLFAVYGMIGHRNVGCEKQTLSMFRLSRPMLCGEASKFRFCRLGQLNGREYAISLFQNSIF